jgi:hypothetical protein
MSDDLIPRRRLSAGNPATTTMVLTLFPTYFIDSMRRTRENSTGRKLLGYYWGPANRRTGRDGQVSGPGFVADAKDFPPGTRLVVTARVELPAETVVEEWQHGDVVLDARSNIWTRAHPDDQAQGWPWASGADSTFTRHGQPYAAEGGHPEDAPVRPLTLLVRNGQRWTG